MSHYLSNYRETSRLVPAADVTKTLISPWQTVKHLHVYMMNILVIKNAFKFISCSEVKDANVKTTCTDISWRSVPSPVYTVEQTWQFWHWAACHQTVRKGWALSAVTCKQTDLAQGHTWTLLGLWGEHIDRILTWQQWVVDKFKKQARMKENDGVVETDSDSSLKRVT